MPGDRFCRACGFELADGPAAGQPPAPDGEPVAERRVCSVLFCDLVGFTPLSESRDPEAVRELLSRYFGVARTMIGRYGGTVEKFIGEGMVAGDAVNTAARVQATAGARLATQVGDTFTLGRTLSNLSHVLGCFHPADAAEAARSAAGHLRRAGARDYLAFAIFNLGQALMMLGDWDAAEAELTQAADADGLAGNEIIVAHRAWLTAMRGDADQAQRPRSHGSSRCTSPNSCHR